MLLQFSHLTILDRISLPPDAFLEQTLLQAVVGVYVYPSSAPLHVAHRRLGARTQSRVLMTPGSCLLRGESARQNWTLAIPPLLLNSSTSNAAGSEALRTPRLWSERTRKLALLSDHATRERDLAALSYTVRVHRPE